MVRPRRFERLTYSFGGCCSIQLSYGRVQEKRSIRGIMMHVRKTLLTVSVAAVSCFGVCSVLAQGSGSCPSAPVGDHGQVVNGKALASPAATAETKLDGKAVTIHYNAPSVRCRKIMGDLVPFGQVWRTGANPATTLITKTSLKIGELEVPAGAYTLYTLPAAAGTPWQLIVNKQTGQWGTVYKPEMDLGRTPMMAKPVGKPQEVMSISFDDVHGKTGMLHVRWADVDEYVRVQTN